MTAAVAAGELPLIQGYLVHLSAGLPHAHGKTSPTAGLAGRASLAVDCLRSQLGNRLAKDRRRAPSPARPLSAWSVPSHLYHNRGIRKPLPAVERRSVATLLSDD